MAYGDYGDGLSALGDPTRRAIFEQLAARPRAVGELSREFPISRPAVSQHLKVLKDAGLVIDRPDGNRRATGELSHHHLGDAALRHGSDRLLPVH